MGLLVLGAAPLIGSLSMDPESWWAAQLAILENAHTTIRGLIVVQGLLAFLAAIGLLRLRRTAWVLAMAVQGIQLLIALVLYFTTKPWYAYPIMAFGVLMVLYLNYSAVADAFPADNPPPEGGRRK
jgi:hypothetical protein